MNKKEKEKKMFSEFEKEVNDFLQKRYESQRKGAD